MQAGRQQISSRHQAGSAQRFRVMSGGKTCVANFMETPNWVWYCMVPTHFWQVIGGGSLACCLRTLVTARKLDRKLIYLHFIMIYLWVLLELARLRNLQSWLPHLTTNPWNRGCMCLGDVEWVIDPVIQLLIALLSRQSSKNRLRALPK